MRARKIVIAGLAAFAFSITVLNAQPPPPQGGGTDAPIDRGAAFLLVAAAAYGYFKLKAKPVEVQEAQ
jgi:hypothetical protein